MQNTSIEKQKLHGVIEKFFLPPVEDLSKIEDYMIRLSIKKNREEELTYIWNELVRLKLLLAGGAITALFSNANVNDLDFYLTDPKMREAAIEFLGKYFKEPPFMSPNCITFKRKSNLSRKIWRAQLITRFSGSAEEIFRNFDFTVTTGAFDFSLNSFMFGDRFFIDLSSRTLHYMGASRYPICALYRSTKYRDRGYRLPGSTVMHIGLSILQLDIKTYKELKEQLLGIDTIYLQHLLERPEFGPDVPVDYGKFVADALAYMHVHLDDDDE